jgi:hypothetical protein
LGARKQVSVAITDLPPAAVDLFGAGATIFSYAYRQIKNRGYIKPSSTVGETEYKWKTAIT